MTLKKTSGDRSSSELSPRFSPCFLTTNVYKEQQKEKYVELTSLQKETFTKKAESTTEMGKCFSVQHHAGTATRWDTITGRNISGQSTRRIQVWQGQGCKHCPPKARMAFAAPGYQPPVCQRPQLSVLVIHLSDHMVGRLFPLAEVNLTGRVLLTQFVVGSLARSLFHQQVRILCEGNGWDGVGWGEWMAVVFPTSQDLKDLSGLMLSNASLCLWSLFLYHRHVHNVCLVKKALEGDIQLEVIFTPASLNQHFHINHFDNLQTNWSLLHDLNTFTSATKHLIYITSSQHSHVPPNSWCTSHQHSHSPSAPSLLLLR